jgi:hypothetical protein
LAGIAPTRIDQKPMRADASHAALSAVVEIARKSKPSNRWSRQSRMNCQLPRNTHNSKNRWNHRHQRVGRVWQQKFVSPV